MDHFRNRLAASRTSFSDVWDTVKPEVLPIVQPPQKKLIDNVLQIIEMAQTGERGVTDEVGFKNLWNFNLPDANFGSLILEVKDGQVASEQRSEGISHHIANAGFNFDYRRAERRVKPATSYPIEQNATQVPLPTITPTEKVAPLAPNKDVVAPPAVKPPTPASTDDHPNGKSDKAKQGWGRPTAQLWIGNPPEDIPSMFPSPHRELIKDVRRQSSRSTNFKYALVQFSSIEEASAAIETINHDHRVKYGEDYQVYDNSRGSYSSRGTSFTQGSYDRKSGSDNEGRGGFGRGGRGGRGSTRGGSSGTYSSRGSGSPGPGRGSMRGRGGAPSQQKEVSGDKQEWPDKDIPKEAGWPNEEVAPTVPTTSDPEKSASSDTPVMSQVVSSTAGESSSL